MGRLSATVWMGLWLGIGALCLPGTARAAEPFGSEFQVNTYTSIQQGCPSAASLTDGSFVIAWESENYYDYGASQDGDQDGIFAQRYSSGGAPLGTEFQVNTYTTGQQQPPSVSGLSSGGFVIVWQGDYQDGDRTGCFGQRFDSGGAVTGTEFQVNTYTTSDQGYPRVAGLSAGGFVVVWQSEPSQDGDAYGVFGQRFDSSGAMAGNEFQVNTYTSSNQGLPRAAALSGGGFVVVWESGGQHDGESYGIFGQRYDSSGAGTGTEFQINTYTSDGAEGTRCRRSFERRLRGGLGRRGCTGW